MRSLVGLGGAFLLFAASFGLHIVGGATDQGWLFAIAVVLIYVTASGFPAIAWLIAGSRRDNRLIDQVGAAIGLILTIAALRAANDRTFEWWMVPLAFAAVVFTNFVILLVAKIVANARRPRAEAEA